MATDSTDIQRTATCARCQATFGDRVGGRRRVCDACRAAVEEARWRRRYGERRDELLARRRARYRANVEAERARARGYRAEHLEEERARDRRRARRLDAGLGG